LVVKIEPQFIPADDITSWKPVGAWYNK
jgi:hypothetical protein